MPGSCARYQAELFAPTASGSEQQPPCCPRPSRLAWGTTGAQEMSSSRSKYFLAVPLVMPLCPAISSPSCPGWLLCS